MDYNEFCSVDYAGAVQVVILAITPTVGGCGGQVEGTKGYGYPVLCGYSIGTCGEETEQSRRTDD